MLRITPLFLALSTSALLLACSGERTPKAPSPETDQATTSQQSQATEKPTVNAPAVPAATPKSEPTAPAVREKPSEEACKLACKRILGLAVEEVPEVRRGGAQSFMDAVVNDACPDKCMRSGTRASVACVNAAKTYEEAKSCPATP